MSGTAEPTSGPSKASGDGTRVSIATWAPLVTSVISLILFGAGYVIAYVSGDKNTQVLMAGAVISMATTTMNYWTTSSASSRAKDDRQADQMDRQTQALAVSVPATAIPPTVSPAELITALKDNTAATVQSAAASSANTTATTANTSTQGTNP